MDSMHLFYKLTPVSDTRLRAFMFQPYQSINKATKNSVNCLPKHIFFRAIKSQNKARNGACVTNPCSSNTLCSSNFKSQNYSIFAS